MAKKITWEDKEHILPYGTRENQVWDLDMNEIKTVVNANADSLAGLEGGYQGVLLIADTPINDGYYLAGESGTYTNAGSLVVDLTNTIVFINKIDTNYTLTEIDVPVTLTQTIDPANTTEAPSNKAVSDYIATLRGGEVASGETKDVSGNDIYDYVNKSTIERHKLIDSMYNYAYDYNNNILRYSNPLGMLSIIPNTIINGGYPNIIKIDGVGAGAGLYNMATSISGFTENKSLSFVLDLTNNNAPTYFRTDFTFKNFGSSNVGSTNLAINTTTAEGVLHDDINFTYTIYKKEGLVFYVRVDFKQSYIFNLNLQFGSYSNNVAYIGNICLAENVITNDELNVLQTDLKDSPYLSVGKSDVENVKNQYFDDNGTFNTYNYPSITPTVIKRGFLIPSTLTATSITPDIEIIENRKAFLFDGFPTTSSQLIQTFNIDQFSTPTDEIKNSISVGFWIKIPELKNYLKFKISGANYVWLKGLWLGEHETEDYYLGVIDEQDGWYFINYINKVQDSFEFEIGELGTVTTTECYLGGFTILTGEHKITSRYNYPTITDSSIVGKSICMVGDSTTSGTILGKRFAALSGVSDVWFAAENGASLAKSSANPWIYNYKDYIISSDADFIIYNISSNDIGNIAGTFDDVDDAGVTNSLYKFYFEMIRYILTNTTSISGTSKLNLKDKGHFLNSWIIRNDKALEIATSSITENNNVINEISKYFTLNFIDVGRSVGWNYYNASDYGDGVHPNAFIHDRIANKIFHEINLFNK